MRFSTICLLTSLLVVQEPIHQFAFLLLGENVGRAGDQESDGNDDPHVPERAEQSARL